VVGGQRHAPVALPPGKARYGRLDGPHVRSQRVWKISPTPGFDPRTDQPVASRYTDYTNPVHVTYPIRIETCVNEGTLHAEWVQCILIGS
jgi:hypothetical protein